MRGRSQHPTRNLAPLCAGLLGLLTAVAVAAPRPNPPAKICIGSKCANSATSSSSGIKWHPGHYMGIRGQHRNVPAELSMIDQIENEPTIRGVLVDFKWRTLETDKDVYDFSMVDTYLKQVKALKTNKRLIIRVENRGFGGTDGVVVPDYLMTDAYNGGQMAMAHGVTARIWEQAVMDRLIALHVALGKRYDSDPQVEGISTSETAISFNSSHPAPSTYSDNNLLEQIKRLLSAERDAWPTTLLFVENNYLGSDSMMKSLTDFAVSNQVAVGGPDVIPTRTIQSDAIAGGKTGTDYRGRVAIKAEVQLPELGQVYNFPLADIYAMAVTQHKSNYVIWDRNMSYGSLAQRWTTGILPFIRSVNGATVTDCPSGFTAGCNTGN